MPAEGATRRVILVADDDPLQRELVQATLAGGEYDVVLVDDGRAALQRARQLQPVLLFLDVEMPGLTGLEVCRELRADGDRSTIVMLTAQAREADQARGMAAGADHYLTKPFSPLQLLELTEQLMADLG